MRDIFNKEVVNEILGSDIELLDTLEFLSFNEWLMISY